jgi:Alpha/beta hydrolase domain
MTTITGPVRGGSHGWPFGAATVDLAAQGYVEEEYFVEGVAPRYRLLGEPTRDGRWAAERGGSDPFKTRVVVRRPLDAARFNGTLIVEWNNVSAGCEIFEAGDTPVIFDDGFAYAGVSAQHVGVHGFANNPNGLVAWDPERYGTLHVDDDGLSYGVFAEVTRVLGADRPTAPIDPLGGLAVRRLLGAGGSQSAGRLATYINAVEPIERLFDGFVAFTWFGSGSSIDDPAVLDLSGGVMQRPVSYPTQLRTDLGVPIMVVNSECETLACYPVRQPDEDQFRFWEVAGAPHGPRLHMERIAPKMARDGVNAVPVDMLGALSPVPWAPNLDAALAYFPDWMDGGPPPPSQPLIEVAGDPPRIVRDGDGNAVGGLRTPDMDAPLARHVAAMEESSGGLMGEWFPFDAGVVRARYGDAAGYAKAYEAATHAAVEAGVLRPSDAAAAIARASATPFPA